MNAAGKVDKTTTPEAKTEENGGTGEAENGGNENSNQQDLLNRIIGHWKSTTTQKTTEQTSPQNASPRDNDKKGQKRPNN